MPLLLRGGNLLIAVLLVLRGDKRDEESPPSVVPSPPPAFPLEELILGLACFYALPCLVLSCLVTFCTEGRERRYHSTLSLYLRSIMGSNDSLELQGVVAIRNT
jgi:hypothetical protein